MRAMIMLCDFAQVVDGKLYILGGGWNLMPFPPSPSTIVLRLEIPEDREGVPVQVDLALELVDTDGRPVLNQDPAGPQPIRIELSGEFSRAAGLAPPGSPIEAPFAWPLPPLPVLPGGRYTWRLEVNGEAKEDWHADFSVRHSS